MLADLRAAPASGEDQTLSPELRQVVAHGALARAEAEGIIRNHVIAGSAATLLPVPLLDLAVLVDVQINLIGRLADHYGIGYNPLGRNLLVALLASLLPIAATGAGLSAMKVVPGFGALLGGTTLSALSSLTTYAVGRVFADHFEAGGTLTDLDLRAMRRRLREAIAQQHRRAPAPATAGPG